MSNKSGTSPQVISLPQGGGALSGIGETFSPDLFTGTGNFTVPIALPPGRNGFQPELSLVYSTGSGNGPFGLGWSLNIPGVSRKTSRRVPVYDDAEDTFILSGAEDLVPVEESETQVRFRPRTEGLFAQIIHHQDADNNYWEVRSKDGLVSFYGTAATSGDDPGAVADPIDRTKVFAWKLTRTIDPFSNRIEYEYQRDTGDDGTHHWDQIYLKRIRYIDYGDDSNPQFLVSVTFDYGGPVVQRPDSFSDYRAGFEIRTRRRCERILVRTHADENRLIRTYRLSYTNDRHNNVSLLNQITVVGHDGDRAEELPPLEFDYTRFEPEGRDFFPLEGSELPARSLADPDLELADLFGNGLPDVLELNGTVRYWRNLGSGRFDLPRSMREAPAGLALADPGVQLLDADGDGRIDLMATQNGMSGYFPLQFNGEWDRRSFRRHELAPTFNLEDPEVKLVDLDGDGVTDAIRSGTRLECFFNDPEEGWNDTRFVQRRDIAAFPDIDFSDPRVKWADISGDGLQDIALVYDGNVEYWPNMGYGNWGRRVSMRNSPRFPHGYDPRRILVGDVDGDGLADIVYVDHCKVILWINQSGNRWSDPIEIDGTPDTTDMDAVRLADVLGGGISGVLWSRDAVAPGRETMFFLDFAGGLKPYLLNRMDNHIGAVTRVAYAPSTRFYQEDRRRPETCWKTPLPFPVQGVARVEVIDEISKGKLTTEYRYHHGYWDGAEREFRGFGMVEQQDTETFEDYSSAGLHGERTEFHAVGERRHFSPPLLTKTWFHQGAVGDEHGEWVESDYHQEFWPDDPSLLSRSGTMSAFLSALPRRVKRDALRALRGRVLRTELYALDDTEGVNRPYTVTEHLHGVCGVLDDGRTASLACNAGQLPPDWTADDSATRIFFPHTLAQRTTQWERGDDPMTQFAFTDDYDAFGLPRRQTQVACPRGWRRMSDAPGRPYLATRGRKTYAQPVISGIYIHDRVASTTTYEIDNDGRVTVLALRDLPDDSSGLRVIGQVVNYYDGEAFEGRPPGEVGRFGGLVRAESLVLTEAILQQAYKSWDAVTVPPEFPPYLTPGASPAWTAEYPVLFRDGLPPLAGYTFYAGDTWHESGYFVATARRQYDFHDPSYAVRGLLLTTRDPLGNDTRISYDDHRMLPTVVTDAAGLTTKADHDYRVLQPRNVTDPNDNRQTFTFTPLGLPKSIAVKGKAGDAVGDTDEVPGTRFDYDFLAFIERGQPVSVRAIRREHHVTDIDVPLPERDEMIETREYSDGFGRLLQTRTQAEDVIFGDPVFGGELLPTDQTVTPGNAVGRRRPPGQPRSVVVSGWQIYDNKGRVVEKFEPFFSEGFDYLSPDDERSLLGRSVLGQKVTMYYDPRGHVIRTVNPDGSEQRFIYGVPDDLANPDRFAPTPWEAFTYDANDNARRTHPDDARSYEAHWNTPSSIVIDGLGRTVEAVERNGRDASDWYATRSNYDIRGNPITLTDALDREAFRYAYDLANNPLRTENIDAGLRRIVRDAVGNEIERRDSKGSLTLRRYDVLDRPTHAWARDTSGEAVTLRERLFYGDSPEAGVGGAGGRAANRLGRLYRHYDETGRITLEAYDFKANVQEKVREVFRDDVLLASLEGSGAPFHVDWQPAAGSTLVDHANALLSAFTYRTSAAYDALNRVKEMRYPEDVEGTRAVLRPTYNRAGALERITLDGDLLVNHIAYNPRGQRSLLAYGNGIMTRHAYDPGTFRLTRLRSERYTKADPTETLYVRAGAPLQDLAYAYDLAGNITAIHDRAPGSGLPARPDQLERSFTYDPLYRLVSATGRECDTLPPTPPWENSIRCQDVTRTRPYTQTYRYDSVGNMEQLRHTATGGGFTRNLALVPGGNRLTSLEVGNGATRSFTYLYDGNGNMIGESTSRHFEWDHSDRLKAFRIQAGTSEPSVHSHYLYNSGGQRVMKLVRRQGGQYDVRVYIDGIYEHYRWNQRNAELEWTQNNSLHVMHDQQRITLVRRGPAHPDDAGPPVQYHLGDHIGSSSLVLGGDGALASAFINREEYFPYGESGFGSFAKKRYRFTSKEGDEESGLYEHGRRYYSPHTARWQSCDPLGNRDGMNLYAFAKHNPVRFRDFTGLQVHAIELLELYLAAEAFDVTTTAGVEIGVTVGPTAYNLEGGLYFGPEGEVGLFGGANWAPGLRLALEASAARTWSFVAGPPELLEETGASYGVSAETTPLGGLEGGLELITSQEGEIIGGEVSAGAGVGPNVPVALYVEEGPTVISPSVSLRGVMEGAVTVVDWIFFDLIPDRESTSSPDLPQGVAPRASGPSAMPPSVMSEAPAPPLEPVNPASVMSEAPAVPLELVNPASVMSTAVEPPPAGTVPRVHSQQRR